MVGSMEGRRSLRTASCTARGDEKKFARAKTPGDDDSDSDSGSGSGSGPFGEDFAAFFRLRFSGCGAISTLAPIEARYSSCFVAAAELREAFWPGCIAVVVCCSSFIGSAPSPSCARHTTPI